MWRELPVPLVGKMRAQHHDSTDDRHYTAIPLGFYRVTGDDVLEYMTLSGTIVPARLFSWVEKA